MTMTMTIGALANKHYKDLFSNWCTSQEYYLYIGADQLKKDISQDGFFITYSILALLATA
jgi:hypothetical protein